MPPDDDRLRLIDEIRRLKRERDAVLLAHYYQEADIQDLADHVGDSLQLARQAAATKASCIVFCGVHFMAETAKILNPDRPVYLPDLDAGCSLADDVPPDAFRAFVAAHPGALVVTYVNSTAAVKAMSDVCVTSSNAVAVVRSLPADRPVIFAPDRYLGDWVRRETGRDLILWPGSCELHEAFTAEQVAALKAAHPQAKVLVHPECPQPVRALADVVGSTKRLLEAVQAGAPDAQWIVVTEPGIIHQMRRSAPRATFIETPATPRPDRPWGGCVSCNTCPHMRRNTLAKLAACLRNRSPELRLDPDLLVKARRPIERMIAIG